MVSEHAEMSPDQPHISFHEVSINGATPKSSILIVFSLINHPAIGVPPFIETPICLREEEVPKSQGTANGFQDLV